MCIAERAPELSLDTNPSSGQSQCTGILGIWKRCATKSLSWRYSRFHIWLRRVCCTLQAIFLIPLELTASLLIKQYEYNPSQSLLPIASIFNPLNGSCASMEVRHTCPRIERTSYNLTSDDPDPRKISDCTSDLLKHFGMLD